MSIYQQDTQLENKKKKKRKIIPLKVPRQLNREKLFNKQCWNNSISTCKRMKLDHCLIAYGKLTKSRLQIKMKVKTIKTLGKKTVYFSDLG